MAIYVELRDQSGRVRTGLTDPSGGIFDAAGDFDRFIDRPPYSYPQSTLPVLQSLDPFDETELQSGAMAGLIANCARALAVAMDGLERRGLLRLQVLAYECSRDSESALFWIGD